MIKSPSEKILPGMVIIGVLCMAFYSAIETSDVPDVKVPYWLKLNWGASPDWILKNIDGTQKNDPQVPYDDEGKVNCCVEIKSLTINSIDANIGYLFSNNKLCRILVQTGSDETPALAMAEYFLIRDWLKERFPKRALESEDKDAFSFQFVSGKNSYSLCLLTNDSIACVSLGILPK